MPVSNTDASNSYLGWVTKKQNKTKQIWLLNYNKKQQQKQV